MESIEHVKLGVLEEADVLIMFKAFCEKNSTTADLQRWRNIFYRTSNPLMAISAMINRDFDSALSDNETKRLYELITAYLRKSNYRKSIDESVKKPLLIKQGFKCSICDIPIDIHAHADHIVPFTYVGDELEDNLQMLCSDCNLKKNADLFYQIKYLRGLV